MTFHLMEQFQPVDFLCQICFSSKSDARIKPAEDKTPLFSLNIILFG